MNSLQYARIAEGKGFVAALDQSGGSSVRTLVGYGEDNAATLPASEVADLVHEMRSRVMSAPAFDGDRIIGAILFEETLERAVHGHPAARYLWSEKGIVPFVKVDNGLAEESEGVQRMLSIPTLDIRCERANHHGVFGTKMRSVINTANSAGIEAIVEQQFTLAQRILDHGLVPIVEPEVDIHSADKAEAEHLLLEHLEQRVAELPADQKIMLKLSLPSVDNLYRDIATNPSVLRLMALSGGYPRHEATEGLALNYGMIASFSRALLEGLRVTQDDNEFDRVLMNSVQEIYAASIT